MPPPPPPVGAAVVRTYPCSGASPTSVPVGPGQCGLHHHRVHGGGDHGVCPVEGLSVPGGPAVLRGHPLPSGVVSTPGRGPCTPWACLSDLVDGPAIPKRDSAGICVTHSFLAQPVCIVSGPGFVLCQVPWGSEGARLAAGRCAAQAAQREWEGGLSSSVDSSGFGRKGVDRGP